MILSEPDAVFFADSPHLNKSMKGCIREYSSRVRIMAPAEDETSDVEMQSQYFACPGRFV